MAISEGVRHLERQLGELVASGLSAPPLYHGLRTEYTDVERLVEVLGRRSFSGVVAVRWPHGDGYLLLFRGRIRYARVPPGVILEPEAAAAWLAREGDQPEGIVSVHPIPEDRFPETLTETPQVAGQAPPEPAPDDFRVWAGLLEGLSQRYQRLVGSALARQLEAEIQTVLSGSQAGFAKGRVHGWADAVVLRAAVRRCAEVIRRVAGSAFLDRTVQALLQELGVADPEPYRRALEP